MTVYLGKRRVDIKPHRPCDTAGDAVIHVPTRMSMFSGTSSKTILRSIVVGYFGDWARRWIIFKHMMSTPSHRVAGRQLIGKDAIERAMKHAATLSKHVQAPHKGFAMKGGTMKTHGCRARGIVNPEIFTTTAIYDHLPAVLRFAPRLRRGPQVSGTPISGRTNAIWKWAQLAGLKAQVWEHNSWSSPLRHSRSNCTHRKRSQVKIWHLDGHPVVSVGWWACLGWQRPWILGAGLRLVWCFDDHEGVGQGSRARLAKRTP